MSDAVVPDLIERMLEAGFYPHGVREPVELIQTHVSYVLLTGEFAYKVKKSVNFGFLDYSTLEKREHFCRQELEMNKRGAPELYLEVLPISQDNGKFVLGGSGEAVEYVLKMRQFPQDVLLSEMFEHGRLTEAQMEELGRVVALYHANAQSSDLIRSFGEVAQVRQAIDENYEQTTKYIGGPQSQAQYDETKHYTDSFFDERSQLFSSRIQNNFIRECHGDLHLRNICLWQDKILLFDCIEFNEPFRFVDVMYDVAFTVMDLQARQCPEFGNAFLNTYVEQTGDWEGLQVLPLYLSRQAYVRAKVTSFLLDDPGVPAQVKEEAKATAADYYKLAWEYTKPHQGRLILMSGLSGSGKSTTAKHLARKLDAIVIRSDAVRKHLGGIALSERGGDELYTPEMTQKTYDRLLQLGVMLASQGFTVILDAKYDRTDLRMNAIDMADFQQIPLQIIHCNAPIEVLKERLQQRRGDIADATADLLESQIAASDAFTPAEQPYVRSLDTSQPIAAQLTKI
ncbi:bifunctional aminoglycoside phosphotransferase/ATP-binding protein [Aliterella atlantica]|uniref:gluconokinase n=1 Tax=Aliterella atlantica CENA595 TaxID=1618023 RepID=A0A0D8ZRC9_9CYAN|nr:AAA family ATPase [Aliterella atlantica]KJH71275.1 adenylylsulfate kinase [Aliterella atlantica CENA595]